MTISIAPFRLKPWFSERVWGKRDLRPWYEDTGTNELVGEAWLTGPQCIVETGEFAGREFASLAPELGGEFPLLVKLLFPNEKLSVQVHPNDEQARQMGEVRGKTECWYALEAAPGAHVALGIKEGVDAAKFRAAIADGTAEDLLQQVPVTQGDMLFVDAGTVHAIGPGVVLLETQQTSDVTYRLYDYGRPRELHLEKGLAVMRAHTDAGKVAPRQMNGFTRLIEQKYFSVDRFEASPGKPVVVKMDGPGCLVGLSGAAQTKTQSGPIELSPGRAIVIPTGTGDITVESTTGATFVRCQAPSMC